MKILHQIGAVLVGLLTAGLTVTLIEGLSALVYKMPADLDVNDRDALWNWISTLPIGAFLFLLVAWGCGCFLAASAARWLAPGRSAIPGVVAWVLFTIGTIINLFMIPHPIWLSVAGVLVCLFFGLLGLVAAAPKSYAVYCCRTIKAPIETVFKTLATIDEFKKAVPHIIEVEFLTDSHYGVGTRFRETRVLNGKNASTELEVTELVENQHVRMVSDAGGTIWDTVFRVHQSEENADEVQMDMQMDAIPHKFPARVITPMILNMVSGFVEKDMDSVKNYCEGN